LTSLSVFCADIGSVAKGRFGWFGIDAARTSLSGTSIVELAHTVGAALTSGASVALGFECPLFVPLAEAPERLTSARPNEGNRPWSAGAGTAALATGLVEMTWILTRIRATAPDGAGAYLDWGKFQESHGERLFLWEAFVSARSKGADHVSDARIAVDAFLGALPDVPAANWIHPGAVLSLVGAAMLRSGWTRDIGVLSAPAIVIAAHERLTI